MLHQTPDHTVVVHSQARPRKTAYLINTEKCTNEQLNAIFQSTILKWGGRYNPIIPCDGESIKEPWWNLLKIIDPDSIYSFIELDDTLREKIERVIDPCEVLQPDAYGHSPIFQEDHGSVKDVDTFQILMNQKEPLRAFFKPVYVHIKDPDGSIDIDNENGRRNFLLRNFGISPNSWEDEILRRNRDVYESQDAELVNFFDKMCSPNKEFIFPLKLSEDYAERPNFKCPTSRDGVYMLIGDHPLDAVYYWNSIFTNTHKQFWFPASILTNDELIAKIGRFLKTIGWSLHDYDKRISITSYSLKEEELEGFVSKIRELAKIPTKAIPCEFPLLEKSKRSLQPFPHTEQQFISGGKAVFTVPRPKFPLPEHDSRDWMAINQCWMVDCQILYHPEKLTYTNAQNWWLLPKRQTLSELFIKERSARIVDGGLVGYTASTSDKVIELHIPTEGDVFSPLVKRFRITPKGWLQNKFGAATISDKGRYLSGILDLFGNVFHCGSFFEEPYWRHVLEKIAGEPKKDKEQKIQDMINLLKKLNIENNTLRDGDWERFAGRALDAARTLPKEKEADREFFKKELKNFPDKVKKYISRDLDKDIDSLLEDKILLQGIKVKCKTCGSIFWYSIDEMGSHLICPGCRSGNATPAEPKWWFRLNALVRDAVREHGTIPLILALHRLNTVSRNAFYFMPCLELFESYKHFKAGGNSIGDIDILCISDGEFIIGEVKTNPKQLGVPEAVKLIELAEEIRPDKIVTAAMTKEKPSQRFFDNLKQGIEPLDISYQHLLLG